MKYSYALTIEEWIHESFEKFKKQPPGTICLTDRHIDQLKIRLPKKKRQSINELYDSDLRLKLTKAEIKHRLPIAIDISFEIFKKLILLLKKENKIHKFLPQLLIPLKETLELEQWRDSYSLSEKMDDREPPSLYIIDRDISKILGQKNGIEQPIQLNIVSNKLTKLSNNICIQYVCPFIDNNESAEDFEYSPYISIEYYPDELKFPGIKLFQC